MEGGGGYRDDGGRGTRKKSSCVALSPWTDLLHIDTLPAVHVPVANRSLHTPMLMSSEESWKDGGGGGGGGRGRDVVVSLCHLWATVNV